MTGVQIIALLALALFSLVDLRTRLVPFIEAFFLIAVYFAFPENELHISVMVLVVIWGLVQSIPSRLALPFMFYPLSWPALLIGFGVRKQLIGRADLMAVAMIGFFFPLPLLLWLCLVLSSGDVGG